MLDVSGVRCSLGFFAGREAGIPDCPRECWTPGGLIPPWICEAGEEWGCQVSGVRVDGPVFSPPVGWKDSEGAGYLGCPVCGGLRFYSKLNKMYTVYCLFIIQRFCLLLNRIQDHCILFQDYIPIVFRTR